MLYKWVLYSYTDGYYNDMQVGVIMIYRECYAYIMIYREC